MGRRSSVQWRATAQILIGAALLTIAPMLAETASAKIRPTQTTHSQSAHTGTNRLAMKYGRSKYAFKDAKARYASAGTPHLQCVSFARAASGIELKGNAVNWWDAAAGIYERGQRPEPGSVLNFRSVGRMRLGHVAVVTGILGGRQIEIEHANWAGYGADKSGVSRHIPVIDVSADNDWSAVRVGLGRSGDYGSVYPTYGFIYDRADRGVMVANSAANASPTVMTVDELAEAAPRRKHSRALDPNLLGDAPSRNLR